MRHDPGPGNRRSDTHITDREIELLLTGSPTGSDELTDLEAFVATMSRVEPPHDIDRMATALAATARSSLRSPKGRFRRALAVAASAALLFALSGVAMAADAAAPGDPLYGVDRALERVGIGDGGMGERIEEFEALLDRGNNDEAFEFLTGVIENSSGSETSEAEQRLEAAANSNPTAREDNGGNERALKRSPAQATPTGSRSDGPGQSDAKQSATEPNGNAIGQDEEAEPPGQEKTNENRAEPETAGPKDDNPSGQTGNNSENNDKQNKDEKRDGQPEHANPQNDNDPPGQNKSD